MTPLDGPTAPMPIKTVLILDRDLGFVFWLGHVLTQAGYQALPANSCEAASKLITELKLGVDLAIVSYSLPGTGPFIRALRHSRENLKVIAVLEAGEKPDSAFPGVDATQRRPGLASKAASTEWLDAIQGVLAGTDAKNRIRPKKAAKSSLG